MKIVIAPDSFKESLSAREVARVIETGFREILPQADYCCLPMADGGEGTAQALIDALGGSWQQVLVHDPLGRRIPARYGLTTSGLAVIEMAEASGLARVAPALRKPLISCSRGTGELILAALDAGARRFLLGIGGSATNDGGAGMLQALGARLLDADDAPLPPGGGALTRLARIELDQLDARLRDCRFDVACDVDNPLVGPYGAAAVFGPQKGATPEMVRILDAGLSRFAEVLQHCTGHRVAQLPGAGAAGGMGAALLAVLGADLRAGSEIVAEAIGLDAAVRDADLVVTGEGRLDSQTARGKAPMGVARIAARHGCPVIAIAGSLATDSPPPYAQGFAAILATVGSIGSLEQALAAAEPNLQRCARNAAALLALGMRLHDTTALRSAAEPDATASDE